MNESGSSKKILEAEAEAIKNSPLPHHWLTVIGMYLFVSTASVSVVSSPHDPSLPVHTSPCAFLSSYLSLPLHTLTLPAHSSPYPQLNCVSGFCFKSNHPHSTISVRVSADGRLHGDRKRRAIRRISCCRIFRRRMAAQTRRRTSREGRGHLPLSGWSLCLVLLWH